MPNEAFRTIAPIAGWPEARGNEVEIRGGSDPILPTPFRITETATAALAAIGLAASDLWEVRTGRKQKIAIDTRRATASLRSGHYLVMEGQPVDFGRHTIMGVYPAKNGRWSYLHCNFPNHREAALKVLGVPEDREAVKKAVAQWDAQELEEAIIAAKGAGGIGDALSGIPGADGPDTVRSVVFGKLTNDVEGAADLERPDRLQRLELQIDLAAARFMALELEAHERRASRDAVDRGGCVTHGRERNVAVWHCSARHEPRS